MEQDDVQADIDYWNNAVLCILLGASPPIEVITGFINRIWKAYSIDKIIQVRRGIFLVRFRHSHENMEVEKRGIFYFDSKPFIMKGWNPEMDLQTETIKSLPLWVQLPDLDIKYWGSASLSKIGSLIGQPLKTDKYTAEKSRLSYARLLIEVPLDGSFPEYVEFFNEKDILVRQPVKFEWLPTKCSFCGMFDHLVDVCRKKQASKKVWRRVEKVQGPPSASQPSLQTVINPTENNTTMPDHDPLVFTLVTKKSAARTSTLQSESPTPASNSFHLLQSTLEVPNQEVQTPVTISND